MKNSTDIASKDAPVVSTNMLKSLIEQLPDIIKNGRKEAERILPTYRQWIQVQDGRALGAGDTPWMSHLLATY